MTFNCRVAIFLIAGCAYTAGAGAQNDSQSGAVFRCGNSYSTTPCPGGKAVDVADPRSEADRRASESATRRAETDATRMQRERTALERETANRDRAAASANPRDRAAEARAAARAKTQAEHPGTKGKNKSKGGHLPPDYFTAKGAAAEKPVKARKKKADN